MEKYLGNKTSILPLIETFIQSRIPEATSLSDVFAGTNNVSRYFKSRGWTTAACDSSRFSYVLAQAYLNTTQRPSFEAIRDCKPKAFQLKQLRIEFDRSASRYGALYLPGQSIAETFDNLSGLARVLCHLQMIGEANKTPSWITNCFTKGGKRAKFISNRGTSGSRNYFSQPNAMFLDGVLQVIRNWWKGGQLSRNEVFLLMTSVIEEVVITANVNGTFHDFNRDKLWPNAMQSFQLRVPLVSCYGIPAELANSDALDAAATFARHDICYLDPPYNFRQYYAYYHFLNFIAAYPFLDDVETYVSGLSHVRGQHPDDDFASDFCSRGRFITSLRHLVESVNASHVVLSYYGGRNHWNHWSNVSIPTDEGLHEIQALFEDSAIFARCEIVPALDIRQNYQSRVGEQKELVNEYLFHGVLKKRRRRKAAKSIPCLAANDRWGLTEHFCHFVPPVDEGLEHELGAMG